MCSLHADRFVWLHDVSWSEYERILEVRGDHSAPRISYLDGTLQILSPSATHEILKSTLGRLVEEWCLEHDVEFSTLGSWTIKEKAKRRAVEPDECYIFGSVGKAARPDLAIEVIWTSGGINKLEIYRKLGVAEVWIWRRGELKPFTLRGEEYVEVAESEQLPDIDLRQIASLLDRPTTSAAIRAYRELPQVTSQTTGRACARPVLHPPITCLCLTACRTSRPSTAYPASEPERAPASSCDARCA